MNNIDLLKPGDLIEWISPGISGAQREHSVELITKVRFHKDFSDIETVVLFEKKSIYKKRLKGHSIFENKENKEYKLYLQKF